MQDPILDFTVRVIILLIVAVLGLLIRLAHTPPPLPLTF